MRVKSTDIENEETQKKRPPTVPNEHLENFKSEASASQEDFIPPPAGTFPFVAK